MRAEGRKEFPHQALPRARTFIRIAISITPSFILQGGMISLQGGARLRWSLTGIYSGGGPRALGGHAEGRKFPEALVAEVAPAEDTCRATIDWA
jgi:hypothetical protein